MKVKLSELRYQLAEAMPAPGTRGNGDTTSDTAGRINSKNSDGGQSTQENEVLSDKAVGNSELRSGDLTIRIAHLETLTGFIDRSLGDLVEMRTQIADGTLDKISFDDLWHLFRPGDLVLSKRRGQQQLFKVHCVTGGQMRRRNPTEQEVKGHQSLGDNVGTGTWSNVRLDAFKMSFDGVHVGPEDALLEIKHYTGKKLITDLAVFPLRFHPERCKLLERLEERGRKFMSSAGHRFYEGMTLRFALDRAQDGVMDKAEDMVSEVYVDFEAFFRTFEDLKPDIGGISSSKQDPTETSESVSTLMLRHFGHEVDTNLAESFRVHNRASIEAFEYAEEPERMTAEHFQLLPHAVPAYCFRYRRWRKLRPLGPMLVLTP